MKMKNNICSFNVGSVITILSAILAVGVNQSSASAVSFTVTEIKTDEGFVYDGSDTLVTPTGFNNVTSFTVDGTTEISTDRFFAVQTEGIDTPFPIQPKTLDGESLDNKLFSDDDDYLSAGVNGLSLSTGINKITDQDIETLIFPVLSINTDAIGDGQVDFFVADIANNQSPDTWRLLDAEGELIASLITEGNISNDGGDFTSGSDWNLLGKQRLNRWDNENGELDTGWGENGRDVSGLAFEISDFTLEAGKNWEDVSSLSLTIAEETGRPRTDYAFISSDIDSVRFVNQVEEVPEPATVLGTFMAFGVGNILKKKALKKSK